MRGMEDTETENLFRSKTIEEIQSLCAGFSREMGENRRELRSTVGERYRDLVSAAETIVGMRKGVQGLTESLGFVKSELERRKKSYGGRVKGDMSEPGLNLPYLETAAQIKLLRDIPDMIWSHLENDLYTSCQLYLLGVHVRTNLLCSGNEGSVVVKGHFLPLIERQWESISHFRGTLLSSLREKLSFKGEDPDLLSGIILLDSPESLQILYTGVLLEERKRRLKEIVSRDVTTMEYVTEVLDTIKSTLMFTNSAFLSDGLQKSLDKSQGRTLDMHQLSTTLSPVSKFLPPIIKDFVPVVFLKDRMLEGSLVKEFTRNWLDEIHEFIITDTRTHILAHISSVEGLASIKKRIHDSLFEFVDSKEWKSVCSNVLNNPFNLWNDFFEGVFLERVESIINSKVSGSIYVIESKLDTLFKSSKEVIESESDLSSYVWAEGGGSQEELSMKTRSFSPAVQSLCNQFDSTIRALLDDVAHYVVIKSELEELKTSVAEFEEKEPFNLSANNKVVCKYVQSSIANRMKELVKKVENKYGNNSDVPVGVFIYIGRLYQAIFELTPSCVEALTKEIFSSDSRSFIGRNTNDTVLNELKSMFETESNKFFYRWKEYQLNSLDNHLSFGDGSQGSFLEFLPKWDSLIISEESEDGKLVESTIRLPKQPSVTLVLALNSFSELIYRIGPQSLPPRVLQSISKDGCRQILTFYKKRTVEAWTKIPQDVALQILFDLKFIQQIMVPGDDSELSKECSNLCSSVENHIDPFDLDVFSEHLSLNIQKSAVSYQCIFGAAIPSSRFSILNSLKSSMQSSTTTAKDSQSQPHNVLNTAENAKIRFPLLPIPTNTSTIHNFFKSTSSSKLVNESSKRKVSSTFKLTTDTPQSAGGFFGAMSTSWFGTK